MRGKENSQGWLDHKTAEKMSVRDKLFQKSRVHIDRQIYDN